MTTAGGSVLVTGGTGFLGSEVVQHLVAAGVDVHVLARPVPGNPAWAPSVPHHTADLLDRAAVLGAFLEFAERTSEQSRSVIHAAGAISYRTRDAGLMRAVNVEGTAHVLDACQEIAADRLCHVSSVVAVGPTRDPEAALDEDSGFDGARLRCPYVTTKRAAEDYLLGAKTDVEISVACPAAIFGASHRASNTARFLIRLAEGRFHGVTAPGSLSVVGLEDAADGVLRVLRQGRSGARYVLAESNWSHVELVRLAAEALGVQPPRWRVPRPVWVGLVSCAELVDRLHPLEEATPATLRLLGEHLRFDGARAREELGWRPRPFPDVLQETVFALRRAGALPKTTPRA